MKIALKNDDQFFVEAYFNFLLFQFRKKKLISNVRPPIIAAIELNINYCKWNSICTSQKLVCINIGQKVNTQNNICATHVVVQTVSHG